MSNKGYICESFAQADADLMEVGERLARLRLHQNLTQEDLCQRAGVSRKTISRLENGANVDARSLLGVLYALGVIRNASELIPVADVSPIQLADTKGRGRKRATSKSVRGITKKVWQWPQPE